MAADPEAVTDRGRSLPGLPGEAVDDGGITAQYAAVGDIQQRVHARDARLRTRPTRRSSAATAKAVARPRPTRRRTRPRSRPRSTRSSPSTTRRWWPSASRWKPRARRGSPTSPPPSAISDPRSTAAAAKSSTNRQLLAAYHNAVLMEVEQLLALSEDTAKWAATRYKDRTINFIKID